MLRCGRSCEGSDEQWHLRAELGAPTFKLVTAQANAYRNERCWRQYEKGVVIERGIYDPVQWKEKEEAAKALKAQKKLRKRKQPGPN